MDIYKVLKGRLAVRAVCGLVLLLLSGACRPIAPDQTAPSDFPSPQATVDGDTVEPAETTVDTATQSQRSGPALAPGDLTITIDQGRRARSYIVHVPDQVLSPAPVMIALHGGGGNGADFQTENGLDAVADREGFLAVYPEGTGVLPNILHTWNSGDTCCGFAMDRDIDDVAFLREVIDDLATRHQIDTGRVYVTGHSNGAMMAYRFAAEASDLVTAIVPVGGAPDITVAALQEPVAVLHIHSTDDPRALYGGGEGPPFPGTDRTVNHEPVLPGVQDWASLNGCDPQPASSETVNGSGSDQGHTLDTMMWSGCADDVVVQHYILGGSGHGWPGVTIGPIWQDLLGPPTGLLNASEAAWEFASQFER